MDMPGNEEFGFTIIELMITVVVIAILAVIAVPSFSDMLERKRIRGAAESVKAEFQYARSEAIKQSCEDGTALSFTAGNVWQLSLLRCDGTTKTFEATSDDVAMGNVTFTGNVVTFNSRRGDADESASITLSTDNYDLQVRITNNRIIDICYPAGSRAMAGFGEC